MLLAGTLRFRIAGDERRLVPGETWRIPANVPHDVAAGPEGAVALDVFAPVRSDWDALARDEPQPPRWP